jgi:hypothetical protein
LADDVERATVRMSGIEPENSMVLQILRWSRLFGHFGS